MDESFKKLCVLTGVILLAALFATTLSRRNSMAQRAELLPLATTDQLIYPSPVSTPAPQIPARQPKTDLLASVEPDAEIDERAQWVRSQALAEKASNRPRLAAEAEWSGAVDVLASIDTAREAVSGSWRREPGGIRSEASSFARLETNYQPPAEYDLRVSFTRWSGSGQVTLMLGRGPGTFGWSIGRPPEDSTDFSMMRGGVIERAGREARIMNGAALTVVVQVRKDRVAAFVDGELCAHGPLSAGETGLEHEWQLPTGGLLGIGCDRGELSVTRFEVRAIGASGVFFPQVNSKRMNSAASGRYPPPRVPPPWTPVRNDW